MTFLSASNLLRVDDDAAHIATPYPADRADPRERACLMVDFYLRNRATWPPGSPGGRELLHPGPLADRLRDGYGHFFEGSAVQLVALDPRGSGCSPPAISRTL